MGARRTLLKSKANRRAYFEGIYDPEDDEGFICHECGERAPFAEGGDVMFDENMDLISRCPNCGSDDYELAKYAD